MSADPRAPLHVEHGFLDDPADVDSASHVRENARGFVHPVGTCAIGPVVDSSCHVLGWEGFVVADASMLPTILIANTNLTVAIAERVAELLAD